jgi:hypothetical protein
MSGRRRLYRRRTVYGLFGVALVALAIPITYAVAGTGSKATVKLERYDDSCNYYTKKKDIGTATLERTKSNSIIGKLTVTGGIPTNGGYYYVYLYSDTPTPCEQLDYVGKIKIGSDGHGEKSFEVTGLAGHTDFWVFAYSNEEYDRTALAHI